MPVDADPRNKVEADILKKGEVKTHDMMGTTAYMVRGRMFAFWVADGLVAKLSDRVRQDFIDSKLSTVSQGPQGRGFDDWSRISLEKKDDLEPMLVAVTSAYEHVRGTERKPRTKSKRKRR